MSAFHISSNLWLCVGFLGQALFTLRFLVQWLHSEKHKKSLVPVLFWHFSLAGGSVLLAYAIHRRDPVFIVGQSAGLLVYARNLHLIHRDQNKVVSSS